MTKRIWRLRKVKANIADYFYLYFPAYRTEIALFVRKIRFYSRVIANEKSSESAVAKAEINLSNTKLHLEASKKGYRECLEENRVYMNSISPLNPLKVC